MSGRQESIRRHRAAIAALRQELEPYQSQQQRAMEPRGGVWVDVTDERVEFLERTIAELERVMAIEERKDREE